MDLMTRRRALMSGGAKVPSEYQAVDWIETGEDCYFLTNYYPNTASGYISKFSMLNGWAFGTRNLNTGVQKGSFGWLYSSNNSLARLDYSNKTTGYITTNKTFLRVINRHVNNTQRYAVQDGATHKNLPDGSGTFSNPESFTSIYPLAICALNNAGSIQKYTGVRMYSLQLTENDVIIHDYVPCYRKSDGEIGIYDTYDNLFITNAGSGTFIKGPNSH